MPSQVLRPCDLQPFTKYFSPTGRLCILMPDNPNGLSRTNFVFCYMTRTGRINLDEGFAFTHRNEEAIAAMRPAPLVDPPLTIPVVLRRRVRSAA